MAVRSSIRHKLLIFSVALFLAIFIGGSVAFAVTMWQIVHASTGAELAKAIEVERIKLEASVNAEIAIALKMADSPIIQAYFANPDDATLERIAFQEIAGYRRAFASNSVFWVNDINKKFYSNDAYSYTIDTANSNDYWYLMTLNETEKYNFNINYNEKLNATNLWINAPVFDSAHKPIGILGTGINLTNFINSIYKDYTGAAELFFFNGEGEITGAKDTTLVAEKAVIEKELGNTGKEIFSRVKTLQAGKHELFGTPDGAEVALGEVPALGWYITAIMPLTLKDALSNSMTVVFLAMMAVIAIIFVVFNVFITGLLGPLNRMVKVLDQISTDWDMTRRLEFQRQDEIGTLGEFFNLTFEKMRGLLVNIKGKTVSLFNTGDELSENMSKTRTDVESISNSIQTMRTKVLDQADKVNITSGTMDNIISGLDKLNGHIAVQAESVARSSSAIEQMLANIQSVTHTLVKNTENITSLAESSDAGRADLQRVSADIRVIAKESEGLLEINSVVENIASLTNLLSMNAAIEAAHAGEAGKGFAVVAGEIRKLAESSSAQSKTINDVLKRIKLSIDAITKSTKVVLDRFETIEREVEIVSSQESQIRNAMEEQGTGSRQILEAVTQLNSVTGLVRSASSDMAAESKKIMDESRDLKRITVEVADSMDQMTESVDQISSAVTRVEGITEENKENIGSLGGEIARFKVE
ncbi:MAG: methyl-accepting chemotaxis protein [Treponema sp.]|jgi:methyl-accepting chemotaxis protein|nr:methyl-accepting chemotaxis protein [Treponema sp.]